MLQRYLGNKSFLADEIVKLVNNIAQPGDHVCDAFSGSLAVSVALRRAGFRVSSNDINILSWTYGRAYLSNTSLPDISVSDLLRRSKRSMTNARPAHRNSADANDLFDDSLLHDWNLLISEIFSPYAPREFRKRDIRSDFFDHYCEAGAKSGFVSGRGSVGRRRFLSADNAAALDRAMTRVRTWHQAGRITESARCLIISCVLDAVERVSNIQGTYHDFPRTFYDPRALKPICAQLPTLSALVSGPPAESIGKARDSLDFVKELDRHSVLYIDPPYNFRQYTAYYFLPNLIAVYPEIEDLDEYFSNIRFVRGQNMTSDFSSTFCSATAFLPSLQTLIKRANCSHVILSYFNGKNHWHDFKSGTDDEGKSQLERFFSSDLFKPGSMKFYPIDRLNYQSYGGHKALQVSEYLFVAEKTSPTPAQVDKTEPAYAVV
ncbi:DNA adenine methylase [Caballeronia sp. INML2]|uniref:DNA adenine methylase n=1 Tax=Caballeronia sp. INML2 TaxID=2921748 RepID=UPI0020295F37|nr:DNA adenine methylase [Caballeronia sp. INML2]